MGNTKTQYIIALIISIGLFIAAWMMCAAVNRLQAGRIKVELQGEIIYSAAYALMVFLVFALVIELRGSVRKHFITDTGMILIVTFISLFIQYTLIQFTLNPVIKPLHPVTFEFGYMGLFFFPTILLILILVIILIIHFSTRKKNSQ